MNHILPISIVLAKLTYLGIAVWLMIRLKDEYGAMIKSKKLIILTSLLWPIIVGVIVFHILRKRYFHERKTTT